MNYDSNAPMGAEDHPLAPYNNDTIKCRKCMGTGFDKFLDDKCTWCDGEGELSEREHKIRLAEESEESEL